MPEQALYKLYCTLVLPYLNYGLLLWGNGNKTCLDKVHKLQKCAFRTISNRSYLAPTKGLFKRFNTLNIFDMYKKETGIFMYKYNSNILPQSFDGLFINHQSNHNYNTRNKYDFHMFRLNTVLNTGPKIWNNLPEHIKCSKTLGQFKRKIASYFNSWISQLHFRNGKFVTFLYGQNKFFGFQWWIIPCTCLLDALLAFVLCLLFCCCFNCKGGCNILQDFAFSCISSILCVL